MTLIKSIILGIVQGIAEFLPISSSGHLVIASKILKTDIEGDVLFTTMLHVGTLISILLVYRKDVIILLKELLNIVKTRQVKSEESKFIIYLLVATVPTGLIGILFKDTFEKLFSSLLTVGLALFVTGTLLIIVDKFKETKKNFKDMNVLSALFIGVLQGMAITPGISRSGSTIFAGVSTGLKKENAVKFSFFVSIPAILGAAIVQLKDIDTAMYKEIFTIPYIAGIVTAAVVGFLSIKVLIKMLEKKKVHYFAYYCYAVGISIIIYNFIG